MRLKHASETIRYWDYFYFSSEFSSSNAISHGAASRLSKRIAIVSDPDPTTTDARSRSSAFRFLRTFRRGPEKTTAWRCRRNVEIRLNVRRARA